MTYLTHSDKDRQEMMAAIGITEMKELFSSVPEELLFQGLELPAPLPEYELIQDVKRLAALNRPMTAYDNFMGAGVYQRFIPSIVKAIVARPEFYTAYTPYQAEASQGMLQTIFEFQSIICALTVLDVANASLYDGATAAVEALMMAVTITKRMRVAVSETVHPEVRSVISTFARRRGIMVDTIPMVNGTVSLEGIKEIVNSEHAAVLVAQPTFLGNIEDIAATSQFAHEMGALAICYADVFAMTLVVSPGEAEYDIAVGDVQPAGIAANFGGPHAGFIAAKDEYVRYLPGRVVGMTHDADGHRAYTLTLQAREQHIRREKATSNICTNHALCALAATVYMGYLGGSGMAAVAKESMDRAHDLSKRLLAIEGVTLAYPKQPFLWEFVVNFPLDNEEKFRRQMRGAGFIPGLALSHFFPGRESEFLVCCTEMNSWESIERYSSTVAKLLISDSKERT